MAAGSLGKTASGGGGAPAEKITNGTFGTDTSGWVSVSNAILSAPGGRLRVTVDASGTAGAGAKQTVVGLEAGATYRFLATMWAQNAGFARVDFVNVPGVGTQPILGTGPQDIDISFVTGTFLEVQLSVGSTGAWGAAASFAEFDNVSLQKVP